MTLMDFIFPKNCLGCKKEGCYICEPCLAKVKSAQQICPECQKPSIDGFTHTKCRKKYGLDGLLNIWEYSGVIRKAILSLKYKYASDITRELATSASRTLKDKNLDYFEGFYMVPIPIFWHRENARGFNQSELLGNYIAHELNWKVANILLRKKNTTPQAQLSREERKTNVRAAFDLKDKDLLLSNKKFLLLDDIYTTGSTMREAAKVLKRKKASLVWGLSLAK